MRTISALLVAALVATFGVIPAPAQQSEAQVASLGWHVGDTWTWRMPEGVRVTWTVTTANDLGGYTVDQARDATCCRVPLVSHQQIQVNSAVLDQTPAFGPGAPMLRLMFPLAQGARTTRTLGGTATIHDPYGHAVGYQPHGGSWETDWTVVGSEQVTVPAGTFTSYRINGVQRNLGNGGGGEITVWYSSCGPEHRPHPVGHGAVLGRGRARQDGGSDVVSVEPVSRLALINE